MAMPRGLCGYAECGDDIYAIGGVGANDGPACGVLERYRVERDAWSALLPMPTAQTQMAAVACRGCIYTIAGCRDGLVVADCEMYAIAANTWASLPSLASTRVHHTATAVGSSIYVFGGTPNPYRPPLASCERLDTTAASTWSAIAPMSAGRSGHCAVRFDPDPARSASPAADAVARVLVLGDNQWVSPSERDGTLAVYSIASDTWRRIWCKMPALGGMSAHNVDGDVIVCGGVIVRGQIAQTECWRLADAPGWMRWAPVLTRPFPDAVARKPHAF